MAWGQSTLLSPPSCVSSVTAPTRAPPAPRGWWGCRSRSQTRCSASPALRPARNRLSSACVGKSSPGLCQSHVLCTWICSLHNSSCSSCSLGAAVPLSLCQAAAQFVASTAPPAPEHPAWQDRQTDRAQHPSLPLKLPQGHTLRGHQGQRPNGEAPL